MTAISPSEFLRKYECAICLEPLLEAVTLTPCNHTFNQKCVQIIFNSKEIKCPECRGDVMDIVPDLQTRKAVRMRLKIIAADPDENKVTRQSVKESLKLFPIDEKDELPDDEDQIAINIPEVYRPNNKRCNLKRIAGVSTMSALLILGGIALIYQSYQKGNSNIHIVLFIPGICLTLMGIGVMRFATK